MEALPRIKVLCVLTVAIFCETATVAPHLPIRSRPTFALAFSSIFQRNSGHQVLPRRISQLRNPAPRYLSGFLRSSRQDISLLEQDQQSINEDSGTNSGGNDASQQNENEPLPIASGPGTSDEDVSADIPTEQLTQVEGDRLRASSEDNSNGQETTEENEAEPPEPEDVQSDQQPGQADQGDVQGPEPPAGEGLHDAPLLDPQSAPVWPKMVLELGIYVDQYQWDKVKQRNNNARATAIYRIREALSAMAGQAQAAFNLPNFKPPIDIKIVHLEIFEQQPDELVRCACRDRDEIYDKRAYLHAFQAVLMRLNARWDASILITDVTRSHILGHANVRKACADWKAAAYVWGFSGFVMPHEIFHLLAMRHDNETEVSWWGKGHAPIASHFVWSAKKIWDYRNLVRSPDADCLRREDFPGRPEGIPTSLNPGDEFQPERQCYNQAPNAKSGYDSNTHFCGKANCTSIYTGEKLGHYETLYKTNCGSGRHCETTLGEWRKVGAVCKTLGEYEFLEMFNFAYGVCNNYGIGNEESILIEQCAQKCLSNSECKAFAFVSTSVQKDQPGLCSLKSYNCFEHLTDSHIKTNQFFVKDFD